MCHRLAFRAVCVVQPEAFKPLSDPNNKAMSPRARLGLDTLVDVESTLPTFRSVLQAMNVAQDAPVFADAEGGGEGWLKKLTSWI